MSKDEQIQLLKFCVEVTLDNGKVDYFEAWRLLLFIRGEGLKSISDIKAQYSEKKTE